MVVNVLFSQPMLNDAFTMVTIECSNGASIIYKGSHRIRKFLKSWLTMTVPNGTSLATPQDNTLNTTKLFPSFDSFAIFSLQFHPYVVK